MAVNDEVTLRVVGRYQDQNIVNVFTYEILEQAAEETQILAELIALWNTDLTSDWLDRHISSYDLVGLKAFNKVGAAKTPGFLSIGSPGTVTGSEVPAPVCRTITLYTASTNYRRRGRVMLSGAATTMFDTDDGSVSTAEIVLLNALGASMAVGLSGGGDSFRLILGSTATLPVERIVDTAGRETPSLIGSRRIKQFLIG